MKKWIVAFSAGLISSVAFAQNVTITGKVLEPGAETVTLSRYANLVSFERQEAEATIRPDGSFTLTMNLSEPTMATLEVGDDMAELFLKPGDKLSLSFTGKELDETIRFKGDGATENEYLVRLNRDLLDDSEFHYGKLDMYVYEKSYLKMLDEKYQQQRKLFRKYDSKKVSPEFRAWAEAEMIYNEALQKLQYPDLRARLTRVEDPYKLSAGYYNFLNEVPMQHKGSSTSLSYVSFLEALVNHRYRSVTTDERKPDYFVGKYRLAKELLSGEEQQIICGRILMQSFEDGPVQYSQQLLKDYQSGSGSAPYMAGLQAKFAKDKLLARGSQAPDLALEDIHGNKLNLSDLKGQPVYLYFYSTGNGSSINEQPQARELGKQLKNKDIAMVYVAVDQNEEDWKRVMTRKAWGGYNTIAVSDSAKLYQAFDLSALPAAYMLDADGTIYHNDAKRPSSDGLKQDLEHLLTDATQTRLRMEAYERQLAMAKPKAAPAPAQKARATSRSRR